MDNLHLQMRFTYPKMRSPSMQLIATDDQGAILVYRSGRTGFSRYLIGQLTEISRSFYDLDIKVTILESENDNGSGGTDGPIQLSNEQHVVVKYRLDFDNADYVIHIILIVAAKKHIIIQFLDGESDQR